MKKVLSKVLAVIIAAILVVSAMPVAFAADEVASGTAGEGVSWVLDAEGTLTISGEGEIEVDWYSPPWYDYNDSILNIVVKEGITKIPSTAFCDAENLLTVSIPASVTDMSVGAASIFWLNYSLQAVNVHEDNPAFTSVDGIVFSKDKTMLCVYPMNKEGDSYTIPDTVTDINSYAFSNNQTLQSVVIPDTVTELDYSAFYNANITSITIGNGIKTIPNTCFGFCGYLENITIPDSVQAIEGSAFWYCSKLKSINIGKGIETIADSAFGGCDVLKAIHYAGTEEQWNEVTINTSDDNYLANIPIHYLAGVHFKEATDVTCTTDGHTAGDYCDACGDYITGETEPALGHDPVNGVCQREDCGVEFPKINVGETKTVFIKEEHKEEYVVFVPEESGSYVLFSDNGGDSDNIDPKVTLYDSKLIGIGYGDDEGGDYNFKLVFDAVAGECYNFGLSSYDSGVEYSYTLEKNIDIAHQPTSAEPYVELTWDMDETYQWYTVDVPENEITDQNADTVVNDLGESSYDAEKGWSGVRYEDYNLYNFFTVTLKEGETVEVELTGDYIDEVGLVDYENETYEWIELTGDTIYELTVSEAGNYTFYTCSNSGNVNVKAYLGELQITKIDGQTTKTLTDAVIGKKYVCEVTVGEKVLTSNVLDYTYAITHQPTEKEPYVEVNDGTNVKYQWYEATKEMVEITDEDVSFGDLPVEITPPAYDSIDGWTGTPIGEDTLLLFVVRLEANETIKFVANEYAQAVGMIMPVEGGIVAEAMFDENGEATLTAPVDGDYTVMVLGNADVRLKAYKKDVSYKKIDNETAAKLASSKPQTSYACEVTFADGSTEMSDIINRRYIDAYLGQWYSDAVEYVSKYGMMTGYENGKFGTSDSIQRQDFILMLARYAGVDLEVYEDVECTLTDVVDGQYYEAAVNWALQEGITTGYENGKFGVSDKMTREQLVTFLYRFAGIIGVDTTVEDGVAAQITAKYADFNKVSPFAEDAVVWALANGVISGQGGVKIDPQGSAQRCQVAQIMYNIFINDVF